MGFYFRVYFATNKKNFNHRGKNKAGTASFVGPALNKQMEAGFPYSGTTGEGL